MSTSNSTGDPVDWNLTNTSGPSGYYNTSLPGQCYTTTEFVTPKPMIDNGERALRIVKQLVDKKVVNVKTVKDFVDLVETILPILKE